MNNKKKLIFVGLIFVVAIGVLISVGASNTTMYYLTVDEALAKSPAERVGRPMRVSGEAVFDTLTWDPNKFELTMDVIANGQVLTMRHRGVKPDGLVDDSIVILEGTFHEDGVFDAKRLLVQCPSRYEPSE